MLRHKRGTSFTSTLRLRFVLQPLTPVRRNSEPYFDMEMSPNKFDAAITQWGATAGVNEHGDPGGCTPGRPQLAQRAGSPSRGGKQIRPVKPPSGTPELEQKIDCEVTEQLIYLLTSETEKAKILDWGRSRDVDK
jgi:hypothetical protein